MVICYLYSRAKYHSQRGGKFGVFDEKPVFGHMRQNKKLG